MYLFCVAGAEPQVVPTAVCAHLPPQLHGARARTTGLPLSQHAPARGRLHPLLQVK